MKLTNAQRNLLKIICYQAKWVAPYYMPAKQLVSKGLATWQTKTFPWGTDKLQATEAGRKENELQQ